MRTIKAEATAIIDASPEVIYGILADYRVGHPAILPKPYFKELIVEEGGIGAGTVIRVTMNIWGREYRYHQKVTEPEPGRILTETDINTGQFSTFIVDPMSEGRQARVTIRSEIPASPGFTGFMERLMTPRITRNIFNKELRQLADYVRSRSAS